MMHPFFRRLGAGLFFAGMGLVLGVFTLMDVIFHYVSRRRRLALRPRTLVHALWSLVLLPSRPAFWAMGFWLALGALIAVIYRLVVQGGGGLATAGLP